MDNVEKLLTLHAALWLLPTNKVDLRTWRATDVKVVDVSDEVLFQCGSTGCAIGWATAIPAFRMQGLTYNHDDGMPVYKATYGKFKQWEAVSEFFGLTESEAKCLFLDGADAGQDDVEVGDVQLIIGKDGSEAGMPDSIRVMRRIRRYLVNNSFITKKEGRALKKAERLITLDGTCAV